MPKEKVTNSQNNVNLIVVIPYKRDWTAYYINTTEQVHFCDFSNLRKMIATIDTQYFVKIEYYLERCLPFYINFVDKIISQLFYDNEKELKQIVQQTLKPYSIKDMIRIKNEQTGNNKDIVQQTNKLNMTWEILNRKHLMR
jgi:hypothetical protein